MVKLGFLFGAGAEKCYGMPLGNEFSLDIFTSDRLKEDSKQQFKKMCGSLENPSEEYKKWLPADFLNKTISSFSTSTYESLIKSTLEGNRKEIIKKIDDFDGIVEKIKIEEQNFDDIVKSINLKELGSNEELPDQDCDIFEKSQNISINFNGRIAKDNPETHDDKTAENNFKLSESKCFRVFIYLYSKTKDESKKNKLKDFISSVLQLYIGAFGEDFAQEINASLLPNKPDELSGVEVFDNLFLINYSEFSLKGFELITEYSKSDVPASEGLEKILYVAIQVLKEIYSSVLDYKNLIDLYWHYLYDPSSNWAKFSKISTFLFTVIKFIEEKEKSCSTKVENNYYQKLNEAKEQNKIEISGIGTTNYTSFCSDILDKKSDKKAIYLNGSIKQLYDPYLNEIVPKDANNHIKVPLLFTQSGTKPMTSIKIAQKYVQLYNEWNNSDAIVVIGFSFDETDYHINSMIRSLLQENQDKKLIVVSYDENSTVDEEQEKKEKEKADIAKKIRIDNSDNKIIVIKANETNWLDKVLAVV